MRAGEISAFILDTAALNRQAALFSRSILAHRTRCGAAILRRDAADIVRFPSFGAACSIGKIGVTRTARGWPQLERSFHRYLSAIPESMRPSRGRV